MGGLKGSGRRGWCALIMILLLWFIMGATRPAAAGATGAEGDWRGLGNLGVQLLAPAEGNERDQLFRLGDNSPLTVTESPQGEVTQRQLTTTLRLTPTTEIKLSFLYRQDQSQGSGPAGEGQLLFRYSMDYLVMPNLRVGLNGYLFKPPTEYQYWRPSQSGDPVLGIGPGIKYDLGRWSFLIRSQLESGSKDRGEAIQNWFRVWYSF